MVDNVGGWVWEENVVRMFRHLAAIVNYTFDDADADAVETGLPVTDADDGPWFDYPLVGHSATLNVSVARHPDAAPVAVRITGDLDEVLGARAETILNVLSDPR